MKGCVCLRCKGLVMYQESPADCKHTQTLNYLHINLEDEKFEPNTVQC